MPKYFVELSARVYYEGEVEADDAEMAVEIAMEQADESVWGDCIDWYDDYVELLESPAVDENQEKLF